MAKDGKTEKATPKKKQDARKKGQVLKSKEFSNLMSYGSLFIGVVFLGSYIIGVFYKIMNTMFEQIQIGATPSQLVKEMLIEAAPLLIGAMVITIVFSIISGIVQVGFLFSPEAVKPDPKRINPANYFKQIANMKKTGFDLTKNVLVSIIIGAVLYNIYLNNATKFQEFLFLSWFESIQQFKAILNELLIKLGIVFVVLGIVDYLFQKYQYEDNLKMKKQEVKDEMKNAMGNPEIKQRQKAQFRKLLEKQVAKKVPDASAIIVNPTHYAVAIRYKKKEGDKVPRVIAKGVDHIALYMKEIAKEKNIPIIENVPLARKMHAEIEEGDYIPEDLYEVVGKIIAKLVQDNKIKID
ncbi:EscU/YscU/HrcU family type III secretion system export apparatus switch protein [Bacillus sp. Brlt_9]|uniref:EscU/YscU/HrcU family type III secretion system export apparatus switch protein n=1 Tax=Bacillus sp. Brlt_9 TaxID=3110916 RepID=UPI003F7BF58F